MIGLLKTCPGLGHIPECERRTYQPKREMRLLPRVELRYRSDPTQNYGSNAKEGRTCFI